MTPDPSLREQVAKELRNLVWATRPTSFSDEWNYMIADRILSLVAQSQGEVLWYAVRHRGPLNAVWGWWYWDSPTPGGRFETPEQALSEHARVHTKGKWEAEVYAITATKVKP